MGLIKNVFPVWFPLDKLSETGQVQGDPLKSASATTQLHNLRFVIKLVDKPKWWDRRRDRIMKLHDYDVKNVLWGNYRFLQLRREQFIVQIHKDSICVIMTESYWGDSPYDCFEKGVKDFLSVYRFIEAHFDFKFFKSGVPQVVVSSKDYVNLRDAVVGECKRLKDKFGVWIDNELVLWVDLSVPLGVESHQIESMSVYQDYVQDILKNKPPRPSQLAEDLRDAQNQISYLSMLIMSPDDENESLPEYIG